MADKFLSEAEWKKFAKGRDLKDAALLKALAAFEKARDGAAQVEALESIEKEIDGLRKLVKGDREFGAQLDAMEKAHAKEEKLANAAASKESEGSEDEDEDSPALLTTKLIPLLRELKKGEAELPALIAVGGKEAAVLISRRAISPSKRKMLAEFLGESGMPKYVIGHCVWEANSYTFVVQSQAAGLAKKLRAAIYKQTDLRAKVRVRGEDGAMDDDGEPNEEQEGAQSEAEESPEKALYESRLAELTPQVNAAVRDGKGDVAKIRALMAFAVGKAAEENHKVALQGLDSLAKLLQAGGTANGGGGGADPEAEAKALSAELAKLAPLVQQAMGAHPERRAELLGAVAAFQEQMKAHQLPQAKEALMQLTKLLIALKAPGGTAGAAKPVKVPAQPLMPIWEAASESAVEQTTALFVALRKFGDAELNRMADDLLQTVNDLLGNVDEALEEFDQMNAEERAANAAEAHEFLRAQHKDIAQEPLIKAADTNTLGVRVSLGATLERALDEIATAFEA